MTSEESEAFKEVVVPMVELAIDERGGMAEVKQMYALMPSVVDFIAGWVTSQYSSWLSYRGVVSPRTPTSEEIRRIYDLVRLQLDTASSTS